MTIKINKRFLRIAAICFVVAFALTGMIFRTMKSAAEPEKKESIAYFKYNIEKDTILKKEDIEFIQTPVSLVPRNAIKSHEEIIDKRLIIQADKGDMVLSSKMIERGDVRVDIKELWTIGLDVVNISNYLGGNLKEGKNYVLLYKGLDGIVTGEYLVKVTSMVDASGKLITDTGEGVIKTINVSVKDKNILVDIAQKKDAGTFELVAAPEGYEVPQLVESTTETVIE